MKFFDRLLGTSPSLRQKLTRYRSQIQALQQKVKLLENDVSTLRKINFQLREHIARQVERSLVLINAVLKQQEKLLTVSPVSAAGDRGANGKGGEGGRPEARAGTAESESANASPAPVYLAGFQCVEDKVPLYPLADGRLAFSHRQGPVPEKVAVISLPKAGTYLLAKYLETVGFVDTGVHVDGRCIIDLRGKTKRQMAEEYFKFQPELPIIISAKLVAPGQFFVGHLQHGWCHEYLTDFRRIFAVRDMRHAVVSYMRWLKGHASAGPAAEEWLPLEEGPEKMLRFLETHGDLYFDTCNKMRGWAKDPDIFMIRFEDLVGQNGREVQVKRFHELQNFLNVAPENPESLIEQVVGADTKTYSGELSAIEAYWNDEVEQRFRELGGKALNTLFGYE